MARNVATARSAAAARTSIALPSSLLFEPTTSDTVNCGNKTCFNMTAAFTLECWVNPDIITGNLEIIAKRAGVGGPANYNIETSSANFSIYYNNGTWYGATTTGNPLVVGTWTHIAGSWDGTYLRAYVNGVLNKTSADLSATPPTTNTTAVQISGFPSQSYFDGYIAEVRIWNKALNVNDLLNHTNNPSSVSTANSAGVTYANCVAHYKFLEGTGTTTKDRSQFNNQGIFTGSGKPAWNSSIPTGLTSRVIGNARSAVA